jgi:hypothetical protein
MTLTAQQRQTTQRVDLGGDALEALQALRPTVAPRTTVVTVTTAGLTLNQLIAATRTTEAADQKQILTTTRKVTLIVAATGVTWATGGAAPNSNSTPLPMPGLSMDGTAASLSGMRFYGSSVAMSITEEG